MTQRYKKMQEKLQELEAKLSLIFSLPAGTPRSRHLHSECIQQRFAFLKNLLSAEIASRPSSPNHLCHIEKRLAELEIGFREYWDVMSLNKFDTSSVCSCDESSLNCDGEATIDLTSPELGSSDEDDELEPHDRLNINNNNAGSSLTLLKEESQRNGAESSRSYDEEVEGQLRKNNISRAWRKVKVEKENIKKQLSMNGVSLEKKEGRISSLGKYYGTLISGMTLGMVLMGAAIAMVGDSSSTPPRDGSLFYT